MDLIRDKKGFITIYVMLAMMFFVVFVVTAAVTASRKIKLQTQANSALFDIYSEDIDYIVQNTTTIPIYTQEQFLQILSWLANPSKTTEYMYINDVVYTLDADRYSGTGIKHDFVLKTDLWLEGEENATGSDKNEYPYILTGGIHSIYKELKSASKIEKSGHNIYLKYGGNTHIYDASKIQISTAEDFLKIGTGEALSNGVLADPNFTYEITRNIEIKSNGNERDEVTEFTGVIKSTSSSGVIISGLKLNKPFFKTNLGTIENLTFVNVNVEKESETPIDGNFGIIAGTNKGTISNCNIMLEKEQNNNNKIKIKCTGSLGVMVGENTNQGIIKDCNIQGIEILGCGASNIGGIVGNNSATIRNGIVNGKIRISGSNSTNIGGISGSNSNNGTIEKIQIKSNIVLETTSNKYIGGIAGNNSGTISKILIDGQPGENEQNYGNITINNTTTNADVGLVTGNNSNEIQNCIVNGYITNTVAGCNVGGISGYLSGNILNCYSNVKIGNKDTPIVGIVGGIVGVLNSGTIDKCAYTNEINSSSKIRRNSRDFKCNQ